MTVVVNGLISHEQNLVFPDETMALTFLNSEFPLQNFSIQYSNPQPIPSAT